MQLGYNSTERKHMKPLLTLVFCLTLTAQETKPSETPVKPPVTQLSESDKNLLRALNAELDNIQIRVSELAKEMDAQGKVNEKNILMTRVCDAAHIQVQDCNVDSNTGKVSKKPAPPPPPQPTPSK